MYISMCIMFTSVLLDLAIDVSAIDDLTFNTIRIYPKMYLFPLLQSSYLPHILPSTIIFK